MKKLYAPWRHSYVTDDLHNHKPRESQDECVFCHQIAQNDDEKYFILKRFAHVFVVVNYYPYNAGHLMVLPIKHKANLIDLSSEEHKELFDVVTSATENLKKAMKPHGFNIGINLGAGSGGGIPSHLHVHILPRWQGDTNFLPTLFDAKVVCSDLKEIYKQLKPHFT